MRFDAPVTVGGVRRAVGHVDGDDRRRHRASGRGSSSPRPACSRCRTSPTCPGATTSAASSTTPGGGRPTPVDFAGKRVAVVGTVVERRAGRSRRSPTRSPRSPCTSAPPTGARRSTTAPITAEEQAQLRADFEALREMLNTSLARVPPPGARPRRRSTTPTRSGGRSSSRCGTARASRSSPATTPTCCSTRRRTPSGASSSPSKIRGIVDDPDDRRAADPEGPPLRREAAAVRHRLLRGVQPARTCRSSTCATTPIVRVTETRHRDDRRRAGARHHRVGDRLRLRHRRADPHGHPRPRRPRARATTGPTARRRSSASRPPASRTSSSPAARTPRPATTRATTATRSTSSPTRSSTRATTATTSIEVDAEAEERWTRHGRPGRGGRRRSATSSYYFGTNIPGKPRTLPAERGRPAKLFKEIADGSRRRLRGVPTVARRQTVAIGVSGRAHDARAGAAGAR